MRCNGSVCFLFALFVSVVYSQACTSPNDCSTVVGKPYCVNSVCSQCNPASLVPDCECSPGEYCVTDPEEDNLGTCQPFETDIIGRSCQLQLQNEGYKAITKGENDLLFCGLLKFNENETSVRYVEWEGVCIRNVCRQCSQAPFNQVPYAICSDGRICATDFTMKIAYGGLLSWQYIPHNPIVIFYLLTSFLFWFSSCCFILVTIITSCYFYIKQHKTKATKYEAQELMIQ